MANDTEAFKKLTQLMREAKISMLTTTGPDGRLYSRPMALQQADFNGQLWFFAYQNSRKVSHISMDPHLNVAFSDTARNAWVSLSGSAVVVTDRVTMEKLWSPTLKAWFPQELDEPNICLIQVRAETAEYWDGSNTTATNLFGAVKAAVTGRPPKAGDNQTIDLR